jgi:hypothetical protein
MDRSHPRRDTIVSVTDRLSVQDPHANKSLAQLDDLEDDLEDTVLAQYR